MLIEALEKQSGLERSRLNWLAATASKRYKVYTINKKSGGKRLIEHPSRELKVVQRWINRYLFRIFPVHENATAYKKNTNILQNATKHLNTFFTLWVDFKDFFPSFTESAIYKFIDDYNTTHKLGLSLPDLVFVCAVATRYGALTVGSPSSPIITNLMMFDFDVELTELANSNALIYTRYADDVFISSREPNILQEIYEKVVNISRNYDHVSLKLNGKKTTFLSRRYRGTIWLTYHGLIPIYPSTPKDARYAQSRFDQPHLSRQR